MIIDLKNLSLHILIYVIIDFSIIYNYHIFKYILFIFLCYILYNMKKKYISRYHNLFIYIDIYQ